MTFDFAETQRNRELERTPPWESKPGGFIASLRPIPLEDPMAITANSMTDAIRIARYAFREHKGRTLLRVTNSDGSEIYQGHL